MKTKTITLIWENVMSGSGLQEILQLCLALERAAVETYRAFSKQTEIEEHKAFWQDVSNDEESHLNYWQRLLVLEEKGKLRSPFDDPIKLKAKFEEMRSSIEAKGGEQNIFLEDTAAILFALRLESIMLHPAFFILFRGLKKVAGTDSPESDYLKHIEKFSQFVGRFYKHKPEIGLLVEILVEMCEHSLEMANQFEQIKTLRGLIPICPNCKSIRDDKGYWSNVESYLAKHGEAEFTHCFCPTCLRKLYPEFNRS